MSETRLQKYHATETFTASKEMVEQIVFSLPGWLAEKFLAEIAGLTVEEASLIRERLIYEDSKTWRP